MNIINSQPWGILIESNPKALYAQLAKEIILVAKEGFETEAKSVLNRKPDYAFNETTHFVLLKDMLEYHRIRKTTKQMECAFVKIVIIEVESFLTAEAEYCLLLYIYLLWTKSKMPRLYVLCPVEVKATTELINRLLWLFTTSSSSPAKIGTGLETEINIRDHYVERSRLL